MLNYILLAVNLLFALLFVKFSPGLAVVNLACAIVLALHITLQDRE